MLDLPHHRADDSPGHQEHRYQQVDLVSLEEPGPVPVEDAVELAAVLYGEMDPGHACGERQQAGQQPHHHRHLLGLGGRAEVLSFHRVDHCVISRQAAGR